MFRPCISSGSRAVASTSQTSAFLHTSSVLHSQASKSKSTRIKKLHIANSEKRLVEAEKDKLSVVLGTRPSQEKATWKKCLLARVLVNEGALSVRGLKQVEVEVGIIDIPEQLGYGVDEAEKRVLFNDLPLASAQMYVGNKKAEEGESHAEEGPARLPSKVEQLEAATKTELEKANLFAKTLDLRNANAKGISFENRRRIIKAFSTPENPFDSGRTEVQVALLTYKIRNLWSHLTNAKRDVGNRRGLAQLVHQRAKLLRYLKRVNRTRYDTVLEQVALDPESVEGELVV